jgi:hypothetical protein
MATVSNLKQTFALATRYPWVAVTVSALGYCVLRVVAQPHGLTKRPLLESERTPAAFGRIVVICGGPFVVITAFFYRVHGAPPVAQNPTALTQKIFASGPSCRTLNPSI